MPELEKRAWFQLAVVAAAAFAWFAMLAIFRKPQVASAAFALLALSALPALNPARAFHDERDRTIAARSLSIALRILFAAAVLLPVALGLILGWEYRLSFSTGALAQLCWIAWIAVLTVQSTATIAQYRSDRHA
jgi:hypothetical protein